MNERIKELWSQAGGHYNSGNQHTWPEYTIDDPEKFAELFVAECVNREELLGAIARGWCSEKNAHKTMDSDLALAIFDEVEQHIKQHFGVK
jgi:hypothetical protein